MRLPDHVLHSVVYLGARGESGGPQYRGTAFWVSIPHANPDKHYVELVTARHNLDKAVFSGVDAKILIRPSWVDEAARRPPIETSRSDWIDHPGDADVAVTSVSLDGVRYAALDRAMLLSDEMQSANEIGPGDELQIVGLFTGHRGIAKNRPITRSGIIAAMPDNSEPIDTELGPMSAYLAEVRSLGGLSGSPVFVVLPPMRKKADTSALEYRTYLLGLVHGHWDRAAGVADGTETINQGIAVVVPASRILELLDSPAVTSARRADTPPR